MIAQTPKPPYFAVIATTIRNADDKGYNETARRMIELAEAQDGFLGVESARNEIGITVSYWRDLESIRKWKMNLEHLEAQRKGRRDWYNSYKIRVAEVRRDYAFPEGN